MDGGRRFVHSRGDAPANQAFCHSLRRPIVLPTTIRSRPTAECLHLLLPALRGWCPPEHCLPPSHLLRSTSSSFLQLPHRPHPCKLLHESYNAPRLAVCHDPGSGRPRLG